jgi:hypothetical protein
MSEAPSRGLRAALAAPRKTAITSATEPAHRGAGPTFSPVARFWVFLAHAVWSRKPSFMRVGKAWISLDSLVRIEHFQWVARDFH